MHYKEDRINTRYIFETEDERFAREQREAVARHKHMCENLRQN